MWIDQHPYFFAYLLGCVFVVLLLAFKVALFWTIAWITKANIVRKNLKKLEPDDEQGFGLKAAVVLGGFVLEVALSWINVIVALWQIAVMLLKTLREAITSTPEAIKLLRFPLRHNPNMSPEAVWAYVSALSIKAGENVLDADELMRSLNSLRDEHPSFDPEAALDVLNGLDVMSPAVISSALNRLSLAAEDPET